jgi:lipopolysaccharide export system protein LptA
MHTHFYRVIFISCLLLVSVFSLEGQENRIAIDSISIQQDSNKVEILGSDRLTLLKVDDTTSIQILAGRVRLRQGKALFNCDSCVLNNSENIFEAWRNVQIKDGDSIQVNARHLLYKIDKKIAYLDGGVTLSDRKAILSTPSLEYNLNTDIGIYTNGGKVVNKKTTLTSKEGYYYASLKEIYFKNDVKLNDPGYKITTDSLLYNTATQTNRFIAKTTIIDSSGRRIETKDGYYKGGKAEFNQRPTIIDGSTTITGDRIAFDDSTGTSQAIGNVVVVDTAQGTTLVTGQLFRQDKEERMLATGKPLLIFKQEKDSLYLTADTIFTAIQPNAVEKDTSLLKNTTRISVSKKDSTLRYVEAFHHVKIFSDSLQAVCDSLYYSDKDSIFRLFRDPVLWSKENQITGDTIWLYTKNKKSDRLTVFENSMIISEVDTGIYNQVGSIRMEGRFTEGNLDSLRAFGNAATIYFLQDEDSTYTGINESKSDLIDIYFSTQTLERIVLRGAVSGTVWPIQQKNPAEMKLPLFKWNDLRRPKSRLDLLQ